MFEDYLIVHKKILPSFFDAVLEAKYLVDSGKASNVSQAVRLAGISRSTYYKYRDYILNPSEIKARNTAILSLMLKDETGVLGNVLAIIAEAGASILTISQSLPVDSRASVSTTLDISSMPEDITKLTSEIEKLSGVESVRLIAVE